MSEPVELTPTHPSVRDLLQALRALADERPAHRAYLAAMEAAAAPLAAQGRYEDAVSAVYEVAEPRPPRGVSGRVIEALEDDLTWIILFEQPVQGNRSGYPHAYRNRRVIDARAASDRQRAQRARRVVQYGPIIIDWNGTEKR